MTHGGQELAFRAIGGFGRFDRNAKLLFGAAQLVGNSRQVLIGSRQFPCPFLGRGRPIGNASFERLVERLQLVEAFRAVLKKCLRLLGIDEIPVAQLDGLELIIVGYSGDLYVSPNETVRSEYLRLISEEDELRSIYTKHADVSATTRDGFEVRIHLNAGLSADTDIAHSSGADGVGLYRTEIPFMMEAQFPSEEAQYHIYRKVLESL